MAGTQGTTCNGMKGKEARAIKISIPRARNHLNERIELLERPATPAHPHAEAREGGGRTCEKRARHALAWRWLSDGSGERLAGVGLRERMPGDGVVQPRPSTPIVDHDGRCEEEEAAANAPRVRTSTPGVEVATSTGVAGVTLCFYQIIDRSNRAVRTGLWGYGVGWLPSLGLARLHGYTEPLRAGSPLQKKKGPLYRVVRL